MPKDDYASLGTRIVAIIIDSIILAIIASIIAMPFGLTMTPFAMMGNDMMAAMAYMSAMGTMMLLSVVIWIVYFTYFEGTSGQTPGKKVMHIKVVKEDGKKMTYADALIRSVLRIIDGIGAYLLGFIIILVTEKKQRIGDMAAGTLVVKE